MKTFVLLVARKLIFVKAISLPCQCLDDKTSEMIKGSKFVSSVVGNSETCIQLTATDICMSSQFLRG